MLLSERKRTPFEKLWRCCKPLCCWNTLFLSLYTTAKVLMWSMRTAASFSVHTKHFSFLICSPLSMLLYLLVSVGVNHRVIVCIYLAFLSFFLSSESVPFHLIFQAESSMTTHLTWVPLPFSLLPSLFSLTFCFYFS